MANSVIQSGGIPSQREAVTQLLLKLGPIVRRSIDKEIPQQFQSVLAADDVLQQTYLDAFLYFERNELINQDQAFLGWLKTCAKRNLLDAIAMLKTRKRGGDRRQKLTASTEDSYVNLLDCLTGTISTASRVVAKNEGHTALGHAIKELPPTYRRVVELYDIGGMSIHEVSKNLQRSPGAVYMLRARAHDLLRENLGTASQFFSNK